jgi:hypothetical protein
LWGTRSGESLPVSIACDASAERGDVKGNGFKDVGTWLVADVNAAPKMVTTTPGY